MLKILEKESGHQAVAFANGLDLHVLRLAGQTVAWWTWHHEGFLPFEVGIS